MTRKDKLDIAWYMYCQKYTKEIRNNLNPIQLRTCYVRPMTKRYSLKHSDTGKATPSLTAHGLTTLINKSIKENLEILE